MELQIAKSYGLLGAKLMDVMGAPPLIVMGKLNLRQYRVSAVARCFNCGYFLMATFLYSVACGILSAMVAIFEMTPRGALCPGGPGGAGLLTENSTGDAP